MKTPTTSRRLLGVYRIRQSLIFQPLAAFLAVLLAPWLSWFQGMAGVPLGGSARAFQASAQIIISGCGPSVPNSIIQNACPLDQTGNPITTYVTDLRQLESDAVNAYLGLHSIPATDAHLIYDAGREDLRYEVRGVMMNLLKAAILKSAPDRTTHEQNLYKWLQTLVQQNEINEYTQALSNFNSFKTDPCHYSLDPDLASQYNLSFDNTPWCFPLLTRGFQPPIPDADYFIAYGLKQSYGKPASTYPYFAGLLAGTSIGENTALNDVAITATAVEIASLVPQFQILIATVYIAIVVDYVGIPPLALTSLFPVVNAVQAGSIYSGPVGIILTCILAGVVASIELASDQQQLDTLNNLSNTLAQETKTAPDLSGFINDSVGLTKVRMTLVGQTLPDVPSSAALPAHRSGTDLQFLISPASGGSAVKSDTLAYQDPLGAHWSAKTYGGWFVQTCNGATGTCAQTDSLIADINYVDWSGTSWTASRQGNTFVSTKASPASTDVRCFADEITGVTPAPASGNFSACSSYASKSIPLKDANGNLVSVSIEAPLAPPLFTSPTTNLFFTPGLSSTQTITASGNPAPNICSSSSNLPAGFSPNGGVCGSGSFQLAFNGDPSAPAQTYLLTLQSSNGVGTSATQTYNVYVSPQLAIASSPNFLPTIGLPSGFLVTTTGVPPPKLSIDHLPPELTFTDKGNGTATITGTLGLEWPLNDPANSCHLLDTPCTITATNLTGSVSQTFAILPNPNIPPATLVGAPSATFIAGAPNTVQLTATGAINPISWQLITQATVCSGNPCNINVPWLSMVGATSLGTGVSKLDTGGGTAVLSGTPPAGTSGTYPVILFVFGWGADGPTPITFTVKVVNPPDFLSPNKANFTVGTPGSFQIQTNEGSVTSNYVLPPGVSFSPGVSANISGMPAVGTGGVYNPIFTDDAGSNGTAQQQFTLTVYEGPQITSVNSATFFTGMPGYFAVTTTGFPNLSSGPLPPNPLPPTSPAQGEGMFFTVTGLPSDLRFSNLNAQSFATGTLVIQGTPSAADAGLHQVQITAQNGVGQMARQTLNLDIVTITGPAPASGSTCNGNYNGTFNGNLTVSAGQNCSFVNGARITGNVAVNGGNFAMAGGTINGNLQVGGAAAFSIGPLTTINKNLSVQNVGSGSVASQICGAQIQGNLQVSYNAIPMQIGSAAQGSCQGNYVGGNAAIQFNTALVTFYDNTVAGSLSCLSNTSINGSGNSTQKESGQCSAF